MFNVLTILCYIVRWRSRPLTAHSGTHTVESREWPGQFAQQCWKRGRPGLRLPLSKVPLFVKIGPRVGLGYRRNKTAGTWVVRLSDGRGRNTRRAIGYADDHEEADSDRVLSFWQAQERARKLVHGDGPAMTLPRRTPITVKQALERYEADLKIRGGDTHNVDRLKSTCHWVSQARVSRC